MITRRPFFFGPLATHAEGHLKVTTIVVVVIIDIYIYNYYYLKGHSEIVHGPLPSGPAASCAAVALASRGRSWLALHKNRARPFRFARLPFRALGFGRGAPYPGDPRASGGAALKWCLKGIPALA